MRLTKRHADGSVGINDFRYYDYHDFQKLTTKLADYEDIGTIEEFKALKEKNEPKKVVDKIMYLECPSCGDVGILDCGYCSVCGQKLDWE